MVECDALQQTLEDSHELVAEVMVRGRVVTAEPNELATKSFPRQLCARHASAALAGDESHNRRLGRPSQIEVRGGWHRME